MEQSQQKYNDFYFINVRLYRQGTVHVDVKFPLAISQLSFISSHLQTSNVSHTLEGNNIVDHSDVVGVSPVGAAPTTSSFST